MQSSKISSPPLLTSTDYTSSMLVLSVLLYNGSNCLSGAEIMIKQYLGLSTSHRTWPEVDWTFIYQPCLGWKGMCKIRSCREAWSEHRLLYMTHFIWREKWLKNTNVLQCVQRLQDRFIVYIMFIVCVFGSFHITFCWLPMYCTVNHRRIAMMYPSYIGSHMEKDCSMFYCIQRYEIVQRTALCHTANKLKPPPQHLKKGQNWVMGFYGYRWELLWYANRY